MTREGRRKAGFAAGVRALALAVALVPLGAELASCGDADVLLAALGGDCLLDSDCDGELVCRFRRCHAACEVTGDCPAGERCVSSETGSGVCLLEEEQSCSRNSDCPAPLVCGTDAQCRNECASDPDCRGGEVCPAERVCAALGELDASGHLPGASDASPTPCSTSADCVAPERCVVGLCRLLCTADADCPLSHCVDSVCAQPLPGDWPQCVPGAQQVCVCPDNVSMGVALCGPVPGMDGVFDFGACAGCVVTPTDNCPLMPGTPDPLVDVAVVLSPGPAIPLLSALAYHPSGALYFGASFGPTASFGGQGFTSAGQADGLFGRFAPDGTIAWSIQLGDPTAQISDLRIAIDDVSGDLWISGAFANATALSLGGGGPTYTGTGGFLLHTDQDGNYLGETSYSTTGAMPRPFHIELRGGEVAVLGRYYDDLTFSEPIMGTITSQVVADSSMYLALYDASSGAGILSKNWTNAGGLFESRGLTLLPSGEIVVSGVFTGSYDFGGGAQSGTMRPFFEKLTSFGMEVGAVLDVEVGLYSQAWVAGDTIDVGASCAGTCNFFGAQVSGVFSARVDLATATASNVTAGNGLYPARVASLSNGRTLILDTLPANLPATIGSCSVEAAAADQQLLIVNDATGTPELVRAYAPSGVFFPTAFASDGAGQYSVGFLGAPMNAVDLGAGTLVGQLDLLEAHYP